ncbi:uncharacterized protein LOC125071934 [Vanessa atalanta]|uniref:uncharacterized protein LOC125071934 n=1 Tax=Vanessa atalanta TaxID=42275 RepID=UPI001FCD4141|nr:uncharacterized protein LOC125071934 [Vanessa atalanta]
MSKSHKLFPQTYCERYQRHLCAFAKADKKESVKVITKKIICSSSEKSCSTGTINNNKNSRITTPKKTTKSHFNFGQCLSKNFDYCKTCGDVASRSDNRTLSTAKITKSQVQDSHTVPFNSINIPTSKKYPNNHKKQIQQFYRNENFNQSTHSFNATDNLKKISLNTILEQSENKSQAGTEKSIFEIYPDSDEEIGFMDCDNNFKNIKEFRNKNYFECHSAKSRVNSKSSVPNLKHKCIYRFHLNERLFPVPFTTDHKKNIRCVECYLPLDKNISSSNINGMIQAKVKLNDEVQDMLLMLPVNDSLIVEQRSKIQNDEEESIYFGIIKLDINGDSIFNRTLPEDSLALRYQKGYKELSREEKYTYESVGENDVIII